MSQRMKKKARLMKMKNLKRMTMILNSRLSITVSKLKKLTWLRKSLAKMERSSAFMKMVRKKSSLLMVSGGKFGLMAIQSCISIITISNKLSQMARSYITSLKPRPHRLHSQMDCKFLSFPIIKSRSTSLMALKRSAFQMVQ